MADKEKPIDENECYILVGQFLQAWAIMEHHLNKAIAAALELDYLQSQIVCSNVNFYSKVHILKTAIDSSNIQSADEKKHFKKVLDALKSFSVERNMIAHDPFAPNKEETGVYFLVTKAKGSLQFPEPTWGRKDFKERYDKIDAFIIILENIEKELIKQTNLKALAQALFAPTPDLGVPGLLSPHSPHFPDNHNSDSPPSNGQTDPQTSPSSED